MSLEILIHVIDIQTMIKSEIERKVQMEQVIESEVIYYDLNNRERLQCIYTNNSDTISQSLTDWETSRYQ